MYDLGKNHFIVLCLLPLSFLSFFFFVVLGFELRALHLLGKHLSYALVLLVLVSFLDRISYFCLG
jgi:hypothetical protein